MSRGRTSVGMAAAIVVASAAASGAGGCGFSANALSDAQTRGDGATAHDGAAPHDTVTPDAAPCWTVLDDVICPSAAPSGAIMLAASSGTTDFQSDTGASSPATVGFACAPLIGPTPADPCVLFTSDFTIGSGATLSAQGALRLVVIATGTIDIEGQLDASSHGSTVGAGADPTVCSAGVPPTPGDAGGGQGGSFGTIGAPGGADHAGDAASGGTPGAIAATLTFRGGCPGGDGDGSPASHGDGGGAVALVGNIVTINGSIDATGGAGKGGAKSSGGGGAGTGGLIYVDGPAVAIDSNAEIFANGGGGGGGGDTGGSGSTGHQSNHPDDDPNGGNGADGGSSNNDGGDGYYIKNGTVFTPLPGNAAPSTGEGGGGGGAGGGVLVLRGTVQGTGKYSPVPTP